jgi:Uma2 family endonuclease
VVTFIDESRRVSVPGWVTDLESFRRWADSDDFPDEGQIWWLRGEVYIDVSKEQILTHVLVKAEIAGVLNALVKREKLGQFFTDGVLLSNFAGDVSGNPDGLFVSRATRTSDRIRLIEGRRDGGFVEMQGSPDMVLEIISQSSEEKDDVHLRQAYFDADIPEYWIVDVRKRPFRFDVLRRTARGYSNTRKQDGWVRSAAFGKSFRLLVGRDDVGDPEYTLEVR